MISWVTNQKNCTNIVTIEKRNMGWWAQKNEVYFGRGGTGMRQRGGERERDREKKIKTQRRKICNAN